MPQVVLFRPRPSKTESVVAALWRTSPGVSQYRLSFLRSNLRIKQVQGPCPTSTFFLNSRAASSVPVVQFLYHLKSIFRSVLCQLHICHPARYSWKNMLQQIFIILLAGFPILFILSRVFTLPEFRIIVICFALGSATTYLLAQWSLKRQPVQGENDGTSRVYCLDHGVLNISVPLQTMWMNMGYWEVGRLYV
jgi:hypothetical protein